MHDGQFYISIGISIGISIWVWARACGITARLNGDANIEVTGRVFFAG